MSDRWMDDDRDGGRPDDGRYVRDDDLDELGRAGRPPSRRALNRGGYGPGYGHHPTATPVGGYDDGQDPRGFGDDRRGGAGYRGRGRPDPGEDRSWFPRQVSDESFNNLYRRGAEGQRNGPPLGSGGRREFGEHRGKGPKNFRRTDERIMEDLNDRLTEDPYLDAGDIEVACTGGEVTLGGTVASRADKRRAEDIADEVGGVGHVQNNLRVRQPPSGPTV
ncbi:hypothetical protein QO010_004390 [Caulobacter ginsengisoli]|uniref:BON domain-containing protein n=1 Tax=Caulobacter ginsengisoli TaxID=400775 RepID=A0ABU0IX81_9CAUL|nr:BON domain-containing protein [Caulobacter ginsengisoli]MDQ0466595.1 hypothetical protein [Caulobacter ginsengisoli]